MSDQNTSAVGDGNNASSGSAADNTNSETNNQQQQSSSVSYESHKRLLSEKKKLQERLEALETQAKSKHEEDLKAQNQYKVLYENALTEVKKISEREKQKDDRWTDAIKYDAFTQAMGSRKIESKYAGFVNLKDIAVDPESGDVDPISVQREVERVCRDFPEIIKGAVQPKNMPANAPKNPLQGAHSLQKLSTRERMLEAAKLLAK